MDKRRFPESERTAAVAVIVNSCLSLGKFLLALLSGSIALLVEAFHSLTDIGTSGAVLWATRAESRGQCDPEKATGFLKNNPQRTVSVFIGIFLLVLSVSMFFNIFTAQPIRVRYPALAAIGMVLAAMFSWLLARLEKTTGEKEGAPALLADSRHAKVDMYGSFFVAVALLGEGLELNLDRLAAGIISFLVFVQACRVLKGALGVEGVADEKKSREPPGPGFQKHRLEETMDKKENVRTPFHFPALLEMGIKDWRLRSPGWYLRFVPILALFYLCSGIYVVQPHQKAFVEHFGKPRIHQGTMNPGMHYHLPWPVDRVRIVDAMRVRRLVIGSEVSPKTTMALWTNKHYTKEFNLLTGENIFVDASVVVNYTISSVFDYLYKTTDPEGFLERISYSVLLTEMAGTRFFKMVTTERDTLEQRLTTGIQKKLRSFNLGVTVLSVNLRDIHPPTRVAQDFEEVVGAAVDCETYINEAKGYHNGLIPKARADGLAMKGKAEAHGKELVLKSQGESQRFSSHLCEYKKVPGFHRFRYLMKTAEKCLPNVDKILVPPDCGAGAVELFVFEEAQKGTDRGNDPVKKGGVI